MKRVEVTASNQVDVPRRLGGQAHGIDLSQPEEVAAHLKFGQFPVGICGGMTVTRCDVTHRNDCKRWSKTFADGTGIRKSHELPESAVPPVYRT